jgi:predicted MFS family arabinose efflux permease
MSDGTFISWGWRLPFLTSLLLLGVGLWIRLAMDETPVFRAEAERGGIVRIPFAEAFRNQSREILLAGGMMMLTFCFGYLGIAYLPNYGTNILHLSRTFVLSMTVIAGFGYTGGILISGLLSDCLGRRRVVIIAVLLGAVWSLVLFSLLDTGADATAYAVGVITTLSLAGAALGPLSAYLSELFETRYRYTAVGFAYNIASIVGGAIMPILGASVTAEYGARAFGYVLALLALISLVCALCLRETRGHELSGTVAGAD